MSNKNYYGFKKKKQPMSPYEKYTPGTLGSVVMMITIPAAIVAFISVFVAFFYAPAMIITLVSFIIAFSGSIIMGIDIVIFTRRQKKRMEDKPEGPKQLDIMRIVHLAIGIVVGIIIGYLIWGAKYK